MPVMCPSPRCWCLSRGCGWPGGQNRACENRAHFFGVAAANSGESRPGKVQIFISENFLPGSIKNSTNVAFFSGEKPHYINTKHNLRKNSKTFCHDESEIHQSRRGDHFLMETLDRKLHLPQLHQNQTWR
jgi:hypothetical protein